MPRANYREKVKQNEGVDLFLATARMLVGFNKYKWPRSIIYWPTSTYSFNNGVIKLL